MAQWNHYMVDENNNLKPEYTPSHRFVIDKPDDSVDANLRLIDAIERNDPTAVQNLLDHGANGLLAKHVLKLKDSDKYDEWDNLYKKIMEMHDYGKKIQN